MGEEATVMSKTYAQRAYATPADQHRADQDEHDARNSDRPIRRTPDRELRALRRGALRCVDCGIELTQRRSLLCFEQCPRCSQGN